MENPTTTRVPTSAELAADERRWAQRLYRDARRYERDAVNHRRHADARESLGDHASAAALRSLADAAPGRAAKCRAHARSAIARARRYETMAAEAAGGAR